MIDVLRLMYIRGDATAAPLAPYHSNQEWREGLSLQLHLALVCRIPFLAAHAAHA